MKPLKDYIPQACKNRIKALLGIDVNSSPCVEVRLFDASWLIRKQSLFSGYIPGMKDRRTWMSDFLSMIPDEPESCILDVGSNRGQTLLELRASSKRVHYIGFEPNALCAAYTLQLIADNDLEYTRIYCTSLSDKSGFAELFLRPTEAGDGSATMHEDLCPKRSQVARSIVCNRLDDLQEKVAAFRDVFVKIDVEGHELGVLRGGQHFIRQYRPIICCEVLFTDPHANIDEANRQKRQLTELLEGETYGIYLIQKDEDNTAIRSLRALSELPTGIYGNDNMNLCDYLFVPAEKLSIVTQRFDMMPV